MTTEDSFTRVSSQQSSTSKPRRKRKWDQPHESLVACGVAVSGVLPTNAAGCPEVSLPGTISASGSLLSNPLNTDNVSSAKEIHTPILLQQAAAVVQKLIQPKIQEDLIIAREIVINDADPAVRYKLTKRQTQEEIQMCSGAVVITRGKYRPPNALPDGEKPLYLHISAGAHLKETSERILAVDHAAAMVEELLKQGSQPLSTCVYLGFDADPSLNIVARIRGPNDQYINHIANETGATVLLRGLGSGYPGNSEGEDVQRSLHLFLSSSNKKNLEDARLLAENLLDTTSRECGATRVASSKVYGAVPPPLQLLTGDQSPVTVMTSNLVSTAASLPSPPPSSVVAPVALTSPPYGQVSQPGGMLPSGNSLPSGFPYSQASIPGCTSYNGYAGIYPQATPLQQVALALRQTSSVTSTVAPATSAASMVLKSSTETEKRPPVKRKFQESPAALVGVAESQQGFGMVDLHKCSPSMEDKKDSILPSFKKLDSPHTPQSNARPHTFLKSAVLPPPRNTQSMSTATSKTMPPPPPPPPPKFTSSVPVTANEEDNVLKKSDPVTVPDTLVKLMEYGDDDEDDAEENDHDSLNNNPNQIAASKPFWAV